MMKDLSYSDCYVSYTKHFIEQLRSMPYRVGAVKFLRLGSQQNNTCLVLVPVPHLVQVNTNRHSFIAYSQMWAWL